MKRHNLPDAEIPPDRCPECLRKRSLPNGFAIVPCSTCHQCACILCIERRTKQIRPSA